MTCTGSGSSGDDGAVGLRAGFDELAGMRTPPFAIVWNTLTTCVGVTVKAWPKVVV
jgi:hypothetical protein